MRGHSRSASIAPTGRLRRSSLHRYASWMRSIRPSQHTSSYLFILDQRDRTECICKSQTWLPSCCEEYPDVIAELSRGAGPLAELMRGCSSIQGLISQVFQKKRKKRTKEQDLQDLFRNFFNSGPAAAAIITNSCRRQNS